MRDRKIRHICDCGSNRVEIVSIRENIKFENGEETPIAEVTYFCPTCTRKFIEEYKLNKKLGI